MYPLRPKLLNLSWSLLKYHCFSTSSHVLAQEKGNHYSNLEINVNATQNEIKTSYYRLSKIYHPDKNKGSEQAATKFRDISAAYEVLGNVKTRKLYDRGLANTQFIYEAPTYNPSADTKEDENITSFHKMRNTRKPSKIYTGRTEAYNFDEWTRAHYSSTFSRQQIAKEKANQIREMDAYFKVKEQDGGVAPYFFFFLLSIVMAYNYMFTTNYDNPMLVEQKKERRNSMSGEVKSER